MSRADRLASLTLQIDLAEGAAMIMRGAEAVDHFNQIAKRLRAEREAVLGPIDPDIAAMSDADLIAELSA